MIRGAKTIAEYAIRKWMQQEGFADGYFKLEMTECEGLITDKQGDSLMVSYDSLTKSVYIKE